MLLAVDYCSEYKAGPEAGLADGSGLPCRECAILITTRRSRRVALRTLTVDTLSLVDTFDPGENHFIEVSLDENDAVWLFLHSGSRGVGNKIAQHHIKVAQRGCEKWFISLPDRDLAYLVEDTEEFDAYIRELRWAQKFALLNREDSMDRVACCFAAWTGLSHEPQEEINCHHNYTSQEQHFGKMVWLSRKGAIDASDGTPGLIPGSMGTRSTSSPARATGSR